MKVCFVCASALPEEVEACPQCGVRLDALREMARAATRRQFLFGSVETPPRERETPPPAPVRRPKAARRRAATPPARRPPAPSAGAAAEAMDLIGARDRGLRAPLYRPAPTEDGAWKVRGLAYLLDVALCLLLNLGLFGLVLWLSPRGLEELLQFSLLPLLFVLLCFTALYFAMFLATFQKSLGRLAAEAWLDGARRGS